MSVRTPMAAAAAPVAPAGDDGPLRPGTAVDLELFVALLAQAGAPAATVPGVPATGGDADPPRAEEPSPDAAIDWALPFLASQVPAPPPGFDPAQTGTNPGPDACIDRPATRADIGGAGSVAAAMLEVAAESLPAAAANAQGTDPAARAGNEAPAPAGARTVPVPVGDRRWPQALGQEVRILVERGVQGATLRVSPEHLGPVEVRIDFAGDKANVVFQAAHADTRLALHDAIPRLREMFAGAGVVLGDASVREQSADLPGHAGRQDTARPAGRDGACEDELPDRAVPVTVPVGLVDAYA